MINIEVLNNINQKDMDEILEVWESAVRATHLFLNEKDIVALKPIVKEGVSYVNTLTCVRDEEGIIQAFMGTQEDKIEMLFVRDEYRGKGIGKGFIEYAIHDLKVKYVDVNEENIQGIAFYKHMGFEIFQRSELDNQGNPFPIIHMKLTI